MLAFEKCCGQSQLSLLQTVIFEPIEGIDEGVLAGECHGVDILMLSRQGVFFVPVKLGKSLGHALPIREVFRLLQLLPFKHQCLGNLAEVFEGVRDLALVEERHCFFLAGL